MGVASRNQKALSPAAFWRARNRELAEQFEKLSGLVIQTQAAQEEVKAQSMHAFTNSEHWHLVISVAKAHARDARTQKRRVFRMIADDRDTCRLKSEYAAQLPEEHDKLMDTVKAYVELLEAMGY